MKLKVIKSSDNVFRDLGFSPLESERLHIRSMLMTRLEKLIKARRLTQVQAARLFGVSQPRISALMRGKIDLFSIDTLVDMLGHCGMKVRVVLSPARSRRRAA